MKTTTTALIIALSLFFLPVPNSQADNTAIVIPMVTKQASLKGDLYHTVPFAAFQPADNTISYQHGWFFAALGYLEITAGTLVGFNAPVMLPHNAVISELSLSASDNSNSANVTVWLEKVTLTTGGPEFIPDQTGINSSSLATDTTGVISIAINDEVVDNQNYYYFVYALFQSTHADRLKAVRIKYTLP